MSLPHLPLQNRPSPFWVDGERARQSDHGSTGQWVSTLLSKLRKRVGNCSALLEALHLNDESLVETHRLTTTRTNPEVTYPTQPLSLKRIPMIPNPPHLLPNRHPIVVTQNEQTLGRAGSGGEWISWLRRATSGVQ